MGVVSTCMGDRLGTPRAVGNVFGIVVITSDCHSRGPWFDSRLYPRNFSGSIGSGSGCTQPREDNWVATYMKSSENPGKKTDIKVEG